MTESLKRSEKPGQKKTPPTTTKEKTNRTGKKKKRKKERCEVLNTHKSEYSLVVV